MPQNRNRKFPDGAQSKNCGSACLSVVVRLILREEEKVKSQKEMDAPNECAHASEPSGIVFERIVHGGCR